MNKTLQRMALPLALAAATVLAPVQAAQPPAAAPSSAPAWGPGAMAAYHGGYGPGMMGGGYAPGMMARYHGGYGPGMMGGFGGGYGCGVMGGWHGYGPGSWMAGSNRGAYGPALSEAQVKRIRAIEKATFDRQWALMAKMHDLAFVNLATGAGSHIDVDAVMKQATEMSKLRLQMLRNRLEARQQIDAVLDAAPHPAQGPKP